jgi:predicted ATPase with chaperone activity
MFTSSRLNVREIRPLANTVRAPRTPEETGLPFLFLVELVVKVLLLRGRMRLLQLSSHLKLSPTVIEAVTNFTREERLSETVRFGGSGTDADLAYNLTDLGRTRATEFLRRNAYAGAAPVSLAAYCSQVELQSVKQMRIMRDQVANVFSQVVVSPPVLEKLGTAMNSGRAVFIYGPAGSGKTYLAERLVGLMESHIAVPHAILVDNEVVQVFDPVVHQAIDTEAPSERLFDRQAPHDERWVTCARPAVLTGGELTLEMLELQFDAGSRFYRAPPHLKANNGVFIIDDLGRQRCSPVELMNRWIVPMDRHVDYLSLHTGYKFLIPFDVIVVFSSNFPPDELADEAFLRRIGYKIHVGALTPAEYQRIFQQACAQFAVPYADVAFSYLIDELHRRDDRPLLACYPRDIVGQVCDLARFHGTPPTLSEDALEWAWANYFAGLKGKPPCAPIQ